MPKKSKKFKKKRILFVLISLVILCAAIFTSFFVLGDTFYGRFYTPGDDTIIESIEPETICYEDIENGPVYITINGQNFHDLSKLKYCLGLQCGFGMYDYPGYYEVASDTNIQVETSINAFPEIGPVLFRIIDSSSTSLPKSNDAKFDIVLCSPPPKITSVSKPVLYLNDLDESITILGENFRPDMEFYIKPPDFPNILKYSNLMFEYVSPNQVKIKLGDHPQTLNYLRYINDISYLRGGTGITYNLYALNKKTQVSEEGFMLHIISNIELGPEEVVFDYKNQNCKDFKTELDGPANPFIDIDGQVQMILSLNKHRRLIGSELDNLEVDCDNILFDSDRDPDPSKFNDREWLSRVYTIDGENIYGLIHNEYHGDYFKICNCPTNNEAECWYNSITFATSDDAGRTYTHLDAPDHLVAAIPYKYDTSCVGPVGYFGGSNIIEKDGFYYAFIHVPKSYGIQNEGICLMRKEGLFDPDTIWTFWDGQGFNNYPMNPYKTVIGGTQNTCEPIKSLYLSLSVRFNTFYNKYMAIGMLNNGVQISMPSKMPHIITMEGFYYQLSDDLINWDSPRPLMPARLTYYNPQNPQTGISYAYPSLLKQTESRNFEITEKESYLYYARSYYFPPADWGKDLLRRKATFVY